VAEFVAASVTIAINLNDQQAQALADTARRLEISETELATAAVRDLVAQQSADYVTAAEKVLEKNRELYRRLA
jgi:hypothetical protein